MHRLGLACWIALALALLAGLAAGFGSGAAAGAAAGAATGAAASTGSDTGWVKDSVQALDVFLPDADSDYYIEGFGTDNGARTVISGRVPHARYWSFTAYPIGSTGTARALHDTQIRQSHGRYTVTLATSCRDVTGTCLSTEASGPTGLVVMRLYVPVDVNGAGTGGVPLPAISYQSASPAPLTLAMAAGSSSALNDVNFLRLLDGRLPAALTRPYPVAAPVPIPVVLPTPVARPTGPKGQYANPDNLYDHMALSSARGNLVLTGKAPTYRADSQPAVNSFGRKASQSPQVRYWSVCVAYVSRATGACVRDEQVHLNAKGNFVIVVAPTCPVAGYANCLLAGPEPIQAGIAYRNLLPTTSFAHQAFRGAYALRGTYVARAN